MITPSRSRIDLVVAQYIDEGLGDQTLQGVASRLTEKGRRNDGLHDEKRLLGVLMSGTPPGNQFSALISLNINGVAARPISVRGSISCPITMSTSREASCAFCSGLESVRQTVDPNVWHGPLPMGGRLIEMCELKMTSVNTLSLSLRAAADLLRSAQCDEYPPLTCV